MGEVTKVFGGPGTGKTRYLMRCLDAEIEEQGVGADEVAFITFTREARAVALRRAKDTLQRHGVASPRFPYFLTFHSLATRLLGVGKAQYVTDAHMAHFAGHVGLAFDRTAAQATSYEQAWDESAAFDPSLPPGNQLFNLDSWLTNNLVPLDDWWKSPHTFPAGGAHDVPHLVETWRRWKATHDLVEYADILHHAYTRRLTIPEARVLFADEFQDLSPLQYAWYTVLAEPMERAYIAGDDDQTIYAFQGASPRHLLDAPCAREVILEQTHRFGSKILSYTGRLIHGVSERKHKPLRPAREGGELVVLQRPRVEDVLRAAYPEDTFILCRTNALARRIMEGLVEMGVPFHMTDNPEQKGALWSADLIRLKHALLGLYAQGGGGSVPYETARALIERLPSHGPKRPTGFVAHGKKAEFRRLHERFPALVTPLGEDLSRWTLRKLSPYLARVPSREEVLDAVEVTPKQREALRNHLHKRPEWPITMSRGVRVGTIHSSKGNQAHTVILLGDMSKRLLTQYQRNPKEHDSETRVFYVGATRAVERLVLVRPFQGDTSFPFPAAT